MKNYISILFVSVGFLFSSCDGFLTENPEHDLTIDNAVTSYESAKNIVNGIYTNFENYSALGGELYTNLGCQAGYWDYKTAAYDMSYKQGKDFSSTTWQAIYEGINCANAAITQIEKLDVSKFPSETAKKDLIAEARCYRAFMNTHLLWYFSHWFDKADSPYGIIYRDQLSELTNLMKDRSTVGDSYQYIIDDLEYAEQNLHDYTSAIYMSKQFAQVLHAKLLLVRGWEGDYAKALELVNTVMTTAPAKFAMEKDITALYENGWNSNEVLFARYLGDASKYTSYEFAYSYALYYDNKFKEIPEKWLGDDARFKYTFGEVRAPETWDTSRKDSVLTKLYHRGRYEGPNDMYATYVFRYAELYLMKSELLARTNPNDIAGALKPLNEMRAQYTTPTMTPVTATTHDELMDAIFKEYVVTLFMENETPWFASLRFMKDGKAWIYTLKPDVNFSSDQYCWPIPDAEIMGHTNKIEQNPGLE